MVEDHLLQVGPVTPEKVIPGGIVILPQGPIASKWMAGGPPTLKLVYFVTSPF